MTAWCDINLKFFPYVNTKIFHYICAFQESATIEVNQPDKKAGSRKRISRRAGRAYSKIKKLERSNAKYKKKVNTLEKRFERMKAKRQMAQEVTTRQPEFTFGSPRSEARKTMASDGLSPTKHKKVFKELVTFNALSNQIKEHIGNQSEMATKQMGHRFVSGKIVKKYRAVSLLSRKTNVCRKTVSHYVNCNKPLKPMKMSKLSQAGLQLKEQVREYFLRDDNSRMMPGKADYITVQGQKIQKKVLNDYVYNIHAKFCSENPEIKIHLSTFYKCRPACCSLTKFCDRKTCLCQRHQNVALKLQALKKLGINIASTSPDQFAKSTTDEQLDRLLNSITRNTVKLNKWVNRAEGDDNATVLIEVEMSTTEFKVEVKEEITEFRGHIVRIKQQYEAIKHI